MEGFKFNHELSLLIEEEEELIKKLSEYYDELFSNLKLNGDWMISLEKIEDEIKICDNISKNRKDKKTEYKNAC